jgi:hypothetical protein
MSQKSDYGVEHVGGVEYVTVECPQGHRLRGMKTGDLKVRQDIACPECEACWTVLAPLTNGMEAYV